VDFANQKVIDICMAALMANLDEAYPAERDRLRAELETWVFKALGKALGAESLKSG